MIRILIADDHTILRHGLKQILEETGEMKVLAEAANGDDALGWIRANACDVVLLDISMPGMSGIEVLAHLHEEKPRLPVLILSSYPEEQYAKRLIRSGAAGYLSKESALGEVVKAVRRVASGNKYISQKMYDMLANEIGVADEKPPHETLSNREYQILRLFGSAKTCTEIADALDLSVKTVSTYRSRILEKMHLRNNAELMQYVIENHL